MIHELTEATTRPAFHCGRIAHPSSMMTVEHERAGALLEELRVVTNGCRVPADGCSSFLALYEGLALLEADTHLHIHKENNVLFPAVTRLEEQLPNGTVEVRAR
jgi:regulator of cell morphogenesis and NO signaling